MTDPIVHTEVFEDEIYAWDQKGPVVYDRAIAEDDDVMTVVDFLQQVADGSLIDYDGFGYPVRDGKAAEGRNIGWTGEHVIYPSKCPECIPKDATHVVWYNR